jgi:hypothetical protein
MIIEIILVPAVGTFLKKNSLEFSVFISLNSESQLDVPNSPPRIPLNSRKSSTIPFVSARDTRGGPDSDVLLLQLYRGGKDKNSTFLPRMDYSSTRRL